jgi:trans-aconitate methyltransferase
LKDKLKPILGQLINYKTMAVFGKQRFPKGYQKSVGFYSRKFLHANSLELAAILKQHLPPNDPLKVFELGSGGARNLYYILEQFPQADLYCSDLFREESFAQMHPSIAEVVTFYEGDSEDIANQVPVKDVDLFLVSDHFMHLQYEKADNIIKKILSDWKPKHIMLREVKQEFEAPDHPRLYHNYDQLLGDYDLMAQTSSAQDSAYFISLLKRK